MRGHGHHQSGRDFTHFASLPFIRKTHRQSIYQVQDLIESKLAPCLQSTKMRRASQKLMHLTMGMLTLPSQEVQAKAVHVFEQLRGEFQKEMRFTSLNFSKIGYFSRKNHKYNMNEINVIYLQPEKDKQLDRLKVINDKIIRRMMEADIVSEKDFGRMHVHYNKNTEKFQINEYHLTLFRVGDGLLEDEHFMEAMKDIKQLMKPLRIECDFIDISTRFHYDQTKFYAPLTRVRLQSQM